MNYPCSAYSIAPSVIIIPNNLCSSFIKNTGDVTLEVFLKVIAIEDPFIVTILTVVYTDRSSVLIIHVEEELAVIFFRKNNGSVQQVCMKNTTDRFACSQIVVLRHYVHKKTNNDIRCDFKINTKRIYILIRTLLGATKANH